MYLKAYLLNIILLVYFNRLQVAAVLLCAIGGWSSVYLLTTNLLHHFLVVKGCRNKTVTPSNADHNKDRFANFEVFINVIGDLCGIILYILFAIRIIWKEKLKPIREFFNRNCSSGVLNGSYVFLIILISLLELAFSISRDYHLCKKNKSKGLRFLHYAHAFAKLLSHLSIFFLSFYAANIFYNSHCLWKEGIEIMAKTKLSLDHDNNIIGRPDKDKLYKLYRNYVEVGNEVSSECYPLKELFFCMYLESLPVVVLNILHVMTEIINNDKDRDDLVVATAAINSAIFIFVVIVPYIMALIQNNSHQNYHMKMTDSYLGIEIELNNSTYKYMPGYVLSDPERVKFEKGQLFAPVEPLTETVSLLQVGYSSEFETVSFLQENCQRIFKENYKEIHKNALIFAKISKFDFVPSLILDIPLDSLLYKLTIVASAISFLSKVLL